MMTGWGHPYNRNQPLSLTWDYMAHDKFRVQKHERKRTLSRDLETDVGPCNSDEIEVIITIIMEARNS